MGSRSDNVQDSRDRPHELKDTWNILEELCRRVNGDLWFKEKSRPHEQQDMGPERGPSSKFRACEILKENIHKSAREEN